MSTDEEDVPAAVKLARLEVRYERLSLSWFALFFLCAYLLWHGRSDGEAERMEACAAMCRPRLANLYTAHGESPTCICESAP